MSIRTTRNTVACLLLCWQSLVLADAEVTRQNDGRWSSRVDASTGPASNLTVRGNIHIQGARGHGLETYGVDGFAKSDGFSDSVGFCSLT